VPSKEEIDVLPQGGAAATQGQHQAYFPGDIYQGQIELVTPDGQQLYSRPMGLSYDDGTNTVLIAGLKDSVGQLVNSNQVIYTNAFTDFAADLVYTYRKGGFEQDVVFRQQPPVPEAYGLSSQIARLQLLTEFFNPPKPTQTAAPVSPDGLQDTTLNFGTTIMGRGKAFSVFNDSLAVRRKAETPVYKSWQQVNGRTFLVEELPYKKLASSLQSLPVPASASTADGSSDLALHKVSASRLLTRGRLVQKTGTNAVQLAKLDLKREKGVVLDYVEVNSDQTNYTFQGDMTYLVDGEFNSAGITTFEGGTVIKADDNGEIDIDAGGTIVCQTAPYHPAIFTSINDDSVGESGADTGDPAYTGSPNYMDVYTILNLNGSNFVLHDMRFSYMNTAIISTGGDIDMWDCQFANIWNCILGLYVDVNLHNVLINEVAGDYPIYIMYSGNFTAENVTSDGYDNGDNSLVHVDDPGTQLVALTNCLVTSGQYVSVNGRAFVYSSSPIYQAAGGGNYYLTNGSPYRNYGTANINPWLRAELAAKTTYPPIIFSNAGLCVWRM
jgi:hypothetical protein